MFKQRRSGMSVFAENGIKRTKFGFNYIKVHDYTDQVQCDPNIPAVV